VSADRSLVEEIRRLSERRLSAEEFEAMEAVPIDAEERARTLELVDWFCRRYPTGAERLAYVRRAYRRWAATQGRASGQS
jgi:hypothetical protein